MEYAIKCVILKMKSEKDKNRSIRNANSRIITLGETENGMYLRILEADGQMDMKEKNYKKYRRWTRNILDTKL